MAIVAERALPGGIRNRDLLTKAVIGHGEVGCIIGVIVDRKQVASGRIMAVGGFDATSPGSLEELAVISIFRPHDL